MTQVDGCCIKPSNRLLEGEGEVVENIERRRGIEVEIEELDGILLGLAPFAPAFTLFLLLFALLLQLFFALRTLFGYQPKRVRTVHQLLQGVSIIIGEGHLQGVELIDQRVANPVLQGVYATRWSLDDKSIVSSKIKSTQ